MESPFPRVLPLLPDVDHDYTFAFNGTWCRDERCMVTLYSRNIGDYLVALLRDESAALATQGRTLAVVGSVAWVTDQPLLDALAAYALAGVCLVMQNEEWLRAEKFARLPACTRRHWMPNPPLSSPDNDTPAAAWVAGTINTTNAAAWPRMHRKTLVLCWTDATSGAITPYAVWTGSFNMTDNARASIEDAMVAHSERLAAYAFNEFRCVLAHATPLVPRDPATFDSQTSFKA